MDNKLEKQTALQKDFFESQYGVEKKILTDIKKSSMLLSGEKKKNPARHMMFELPDKEDVLKVTIDKSSAKGDSDPIITYGKKQSTSVA